MNVPVFIEKCLAKFGAKFDYSHSIFSGHKHKTVIVCLIHGPFEISPSGHLKSMFGCRKCRDDSLRTTLEDIPIKTKQFVKKALKIHGELYDYSETVFEHARKMLKVICRIHGPFWIRPDAHISINESGCRECGAHTISDANRHTQEEFELICNEVHNNRYDYSPTKYNGYSKEIKILCRTHGEFIQNAGDHIRGAGCIICSKTSPILETLWLDSQGVPNTSASRQVRLDDLTRKFRVDGFIHETRTVYEFNGDYWHGNPDFYSPEDLNPTSGQTFGSLYQKTLDKAKILEEAGYKLISIWESDFCAEILKSNNLLLNVSPKMLMRIKRQAERKALYQST